MKRHYVFITADTNRVYLEVGYCQDINLQLFECARHNVTLSVGAPKFNRIVYVEEFTNIESALHRKLELTHYTKMQKERLIRRRNPNWLGMTANELNTNKKVVVFA